MNIRELLFVFLSFIIMTGVLCGICGWIASSHAEQNAKLYLKLTEEHVAAQLREIEIRTAGAALSGSGQANAAQAQEDIRMLISEIKDYVVNSQQIPDAYGAIIGADGTIIAHPDSSLEGTLLSEISKNHEKVAQQMIEQGSGAMLVKLKNSAGRNFVGYVERISNGWYIGTFVPTEVYYSPIISLICIQGIIGFAVMIFLCVSLLKIDLAKMRADEQNNSKSLFLATMSHEIRTPMNSIIGMADLILRRDIPNDICEFATIIKQAGNNLLALINDLLDFSKIEAGQLLISSEKYALSPLIYNVVRIIQARLLNRPIDFFVRVDANIPDNLVGDGRLLRQILMNLLGNAVKYTRTGYIIFDARFEQLGDNQLRLIFSVEDSGIGIKEKDRQKLFQSFMRVNDSQVRSEEGTGLGLAIAQSLCRAMGGEITVESEYNLGSIFTATLIQKYEGDKKFAEVHDACDKSVLVYEPRKHHKESLSVLFGTLGIEASFAPDLDAFLTELRGGEFDFSFVPTASWKELPQAGAGAETKTQVICMSSLNEFPADRDMAIITLPLFCANIADILNGATNDISDGTRQIDFTAPGTKVLIVDDISTNLRVSKELMSIYNMEIHTCMSGVEALALIEQHQYDIIFLDHMMPEMDGIEVAGRVREYGEKAPCYATVPLIALTANAVLGQRENLLSSGMDDMLAKPIDLQKLNAVLHKWLPPDKIVAMPKKTVTGQDAAQAGIGSIDGLDLEKGMLYAGGSAVAYAEILRGFCADANLQSRKLLECSGKGDVAAYLIYAHALKGAAMSVGALELADLAAQMEKSAKEGDEKAIREGTGGLLAALGGLTAEIQKAVGGQNGSKAETETTADVSALDLETLKEALQNMNIGVTNEMIMRYQLLPLDPSVKSEISRIEQKVLMFEYGSAIEQIDCMLDHV